MVALFLKEMEIVILVKKKEKPIKIKDYTSQGFFWKLNLFLFFKTKDIYQRIKNGQEFDEYGVTMYCGRQGAGKTASMTEKLERMRVKFPKAIIVTNYGYIHENQSFNDWNDFFEIRNGVDGVIFAIDEIQNEFSSSAWNKFPEGLLKEVSQQRKQRIKILCTSQIFTRVVKQLREQCDDVVECRTLGQRWTFMTSLDAVDYNGTIDTPSGRDKITRYYRKSFIQDEKFRSLYDSYEKIERIRNTEYLTKVERLI